VPGASTSNVATAFEALKPRGVLAAQAYRPGLTPDELSKRRNPVYLRQGEWFFTPAPWMERQVDPRFVLENEPLARGRGSKPHICRYACRYGGTTVYVCRQRPLGLSEGAYKALIASLPEAKNWRWQTFVRDPVFYAKGYVTHPDHATLVLPTWHRVEMSAEAFSVARPAVAFLD
jgi:hypothetical protein